MGLGDIWNLIAMQPMINTLIVLSHYLFASLGLAIIAFTIIIRAVMLPLTMKQLRATKAMQDLQPKLAELQKKYAKDRQRLAQEQMRMYRESGMSPAGCLVPMLIQMPIWIALYWAIMRVVAVTPEDFLGLSQFLYHWPVVFSALPLSNKFLWLNMAAPDSYLLLAILVGVTMWVQQKMVTPVSVDPTQQAQSRMMLWMMPLLFAFLTLQVPSGLALYWVASNIITIAIQYFVTGWGSLAPGKAKPTAKGRKERRRPAAAEPAPTSEAAATAEAVDSSTPEKVSYGESRSKRQDSGRGPTARLRTVRRHPRRGGSHRPK